MIDVRSVRSVGVAGVIITDQLEARGLVTDQSEAGRGPHTIRTGAVCQKLGFSMFTFFKDHIFLIHHSGSSLEVSSLRLKRKIFD